MGRLSSLRNDTPTLLRKRLASCSSLADFHRRFGVRESTLLKYCRKLGLENEYKQLKQRGIAIAASGGHSIRKANQKKKQEVEKTPIPDTVKSVAKMMKKIDKQEKFNPPKPIRRLDKETDGQVLQEAVVEDLIDTAKVGYKGPFREETEQEFFRNLEQNLAKLDHSDRSVEEKRILEQTEQAKEIEASFSSNKSLDLYGRALARGIEALASLIERLK